MKSFGLLLASLLAWPAIAANPTLELDNESQVINQNARDAALKKLPQMVIIRSKADSPKETEAIHLSETLLQNKGDQPSQQQVVDVAGKSFAKLTDAPQSEPDRDGGTQSWFFYRGGWGWGGGYGYGGGYGGGYGWYNPYYYYNAASYYYYPWANWAYNTYNYYAYSYYPYHYGCYY